MVKIISNNIEAKNFVKAMPNTPKEGALNINGKSYRVTHVKKWGNIELIGRRFLGGLLVAFTLGLAYLDKNSALYKTYESLFNKVKTIQVDEINPMRDNNGSVNLTLSENEESSEDSAEFSSSEKSSSAKSISKEDSNTNKTPSSSTSVDSDEESSDNETDMSTEDPETRMQLSNEVKELVYNKLDMLALVSLSKVSHAENQVAGKSVRQFEQLIDLKRKSMTDSNYEPQYDSLLAELLAKPDSIIHVFLMLGSKIDKPSNNENHSIHTENKAIFGSLFANLKDNNQFTKEYLLTVSPELRKRLLEMLQKHLTPRQLHAEAEIFKEFSSFETKAAFVLGFDDLDHHDYLESLYNTGWLDSLQNYVHPETKEQKDLYTKACLKLIVNAYDLRFRQFDARFANDTERYLEGLDLIISRFPDLSPAEFNILIPTVLSDYMRRYTATNLLIDFAAIKAFNLCKNLQSETLRKQFQQLFQESIQTFPAKEYTKDNWEQRFIDIMDDLIFREENQVGLRRLIFVITDKEYPSLQRKFISGLHWWGSGFRRDDHYEEMKFALTEWIKQSVAHTYPNPQLRFTYLLLSSIKTIDILSTFITAINESSLSEWSKACFFRALVFGVSNEVYMDDGRRLSPPIGQEIEIEKVKLTDEEIQTAFASSHVNIPDGGTITIQEVASASGIF
jgi:hypothetical protein